MMSGWKRTIRCWLVGLIGLGIGCGEAPCRKVACKEAVTVKFLDESGWPVLVFSGSVTIDNFTYEFGCNTAYPVAEGPVECGVGGILLVGVAARAPSFFVTVRSDTNDYFAKTVEPDYRVEEDFDGVGCGTCASGAIEIVLDAPVGEE